MGTVREESCPGCGVSMPVRVGDEGHAYLNCSPACWAVYGEVLAREYSDARLFGQVHQLTVDAYALQHAGGKHPDKSIGVHLLGMFLTQERGLRSAEVPPLLQRAVARMDGWPHLEPPEHLAPVTALDVALASADEHALVVRRWASAVWAAWRRHHDAPAQWAEQLTL